MSAVVFGLLSFSFIALSLLAYVVFIVWNARETRPRPLAAPTPRPRMELICPNCKKPGLESPLGMDFPPDGQSDEVVLQLLECKACDFIGAGVYEESRRGSLDRTAFHHFGYPISRADYENLRTLMATCSKRHDSRCTCEAHTVLGKHNKSNYWDGLRQNGIALGEWFRIDLGPV